MDNFIQTHALRKYFTIGDQEVRAVDGVDIGVPRAAFAIIMGPSGSGKSTLLYLLGGLDRPTAGEIVIDGTPLSEMDENARAVYRRNKVGFIFQSYNLVPSMTALDNITFPLRFAGVPERERNQRALRLLELVGLGNRARHRPTELSGGQQQRVAIARALINDPALIVADEPTGNLDSRSGFQLMELLEQLHAEGRTILMVTHDPRMQKFATHLIYLMDGHTVTEKEFLAANEMHRQ
jgi:putative ABC transport system ATP-binding protein